MGRVAKYKKVKAFDPYSKKNAGNVDLSKVGVWGLGDNGRKSKKRSKTAERLRAKRKRNANSDQDNGFDLPPNEKDEFDLNDLMGSLKKQKTQSLTEEEDNNKDYLKVKVDGNTATIPATQEEEKKTARILKVESQETEKLEKKERDSHTRKEGESKRAYAKRTKAETRSIIRSTQVKKNVEKMQKKKEFLNQKKKKKRNSAYAQDSNEMFHDDDADLFGSRSPDDQPVFGEQADRPPTFRQVPRGAKKKEPSKRSQTKDLKGMTSDQIQAEMNVMDAMRRKVQAQYDLIKQKRRRDGDFHL